MPKKTIGSSHKIISNAEANMRAERFNVTEQVKNACHDMLKGDISANKLVAKYVAQYAKK